jgi:hypothetical protein
MDGRSPRVTQSVLELARFRLEGFIKDERILAQVHIGYIWSPSRKLVGLEMDGPGEK